MVRTLFLGLVVALGSLATTPVEVQAKGPWTTTGVEAAAAATYTVWYRVPGQRWTGISGLSYYSACRLRDQYLERGWQAYVK